MPPGPTQTTWRYRLHVEIHPTDARILRDALDGEPFGLRERLGEEELERMIDAFAIEVDAESSTRWSEFESDISILSLYLSQEQITGSEIEVGPGGVRAWRIVARRGEVVRLDLEAARDQRDGAVVLGDEDLDAMEKRWFTLPEWARTSILHRFPDFTEPAPHS